VGWVWRGGGGGEWVGGGGEGVGNKTDGSLGDLGAHPPGFYIL